jgi:hypothetical protein
VAVLLDTHTSGGASPTGDCTPSSPPKAACSPRCQGKWGRRRAPPHQ